MTRSTNLVQTIPGEFENELRQEIFEGKRERFEKGDIVVMQNSYFKSLPLLLKGSMRVYRQTEDREIMLYYVSPGETCMLTLVSSLENKPSSVEISAVEPCELILIPATKVIEWQCKYPSWNEFMIHTFAQKHEQLLKSFDGVAFSKMDQRIKDYLEQLTYKNQNPVINITHQQLANELGTTRVVISRILKCLEIEGAVELLRGAIKVKNLKLN